MPYFFETYKIRLPREKNRRIKFTDEDKSTIRGRHANGMSIRAITKTFEKKISRRMVQLILFPDRAARQKEQFKERRKDGRYYNKEKHRLAVKKTRTYKQSLKLKRLAV